MNESLKPCPFCGGEAKLIDDDGLPYDVNCIECGAGSPAFMTPELAIESWNKRTLPPDTYLLKISPDIVGWMTTPIED